MKLYRDSIDIFNDDYLQSTFYIDMYYELFEEVEIELQWDEWDDR